MVEHGTDFEALIRKYNMTQRDIMRRFGIPYSTIQAWKHGVNKCPEYTLRMMDECLARDLEKILKED